MKALLDAAVADETCVAAVGYCIMLAASAHTPAAADVAVAVNQQRTTEDDFKTTALQRHIGGPGDRSPNCGAGWSRRLSPSAPSVRRGGPSVRGRTETNGGSVFPPHG